jgi:glycosyltransferase involved in cell wall biosynthesis
MRVLFVSSSSGSRGGGEYFLIYLAKALRGLGVDVGLWLSSDPQMDGIAELFAGTGTLLRSAYLNTYLRRGRSLHHLLPAGPEARAAAVMWRDFQPDILHLNKQCLEDGLDLLDVAAGLPVAQGCTLHITQSAVELGARLGHVRDWVARRSLRRYGGALWAIAENRARSLEGFLGEGVRIPCIANGVDVPQAAMVAAERREVRQELHELLAGSSKVVVSIGRLEEQKDPLRFIEMVAQWRAVEPGLTALWVGDGRLRHAFDAKVDQLGAGEWLHCLGWQEHARRYLSVADVYLHPARFEGLPFALLEAMAYGCPCVISPDLAADLKDMPVGTWIIAHRDPQQWLPLVTDEALLAAKAGACRQLAEERFSITAMARAYLRLYQDLQHQHRDK